ncbi:phytoene/squalene synthase family protein [soil metagenome]|nr:phytoene/squalene synthase family protein [Trueperaceae bacterium]
MTVDQALRECAELTRRHSSTFFLGTAFFRGDRRRAVATVYAVCRLGDDAVDAAPDSDTGRERLASWWAGIERAFEGRPRADAAYEVSLAWTLAHFDLPRDAFDELRLGLETDLQRVDLETVDDLMLYCRRVAGVVGWLVAPIAGYRGGDDTLACALALGQAMQLTNVLRDVGEDLAMGRCYLPRDLRERHGVDLDALYRGDVTPGYVALIEDLASRTHVLYREGWRGVPRLHGVARIAVGVAALNYEAIVQKLRQNRYDNLTRRAYLRPHERLALIPKAVAGAAFGSP